MSACQANQLANTWPRRHLIYSTSAAAADAFNLQRLPHPCLCQLSRWPRQSPVTQQWRIQTVFMASANKTLNGIRVKSPLGFSACCMWVQFPKIRIWSGYFWLEFPTDFISLVNQPDPFLFLFHRRQRQHTTPAYGRSTRTVCRADQRNGCSEACPVGSGRASLRLDGN